MAPDTCTRGVLAGVERVPQPQPCRSEGGDCFACSLIAVLQHLFPGRDAPTFEDTDRWFCGQWAQPVGSMERALREVVGDPSEETVAFAAGVVADLDRQKREPPTSNTWNGMGKALWMARSDGWPVEITYDMVTPQFDPRQWGYGWPIVWAGAEYARRLEAWLAAGWLALTVCDMDARGPTIVEDGQVFVNSTNHFLVLDGARSCWREVEHGRSHVSEVHVVDSSTRDITGWIDVRKWEHGYGGTPWMLVRRDEDE